MNNNNQCIRMTIVLFLLLISSYFAFGQNSNAIPFCNICTCINDNSNNIEVTCTNNIGGLLFDLKYWYEASINQSYHYKKLTVSNTPLLSLDNKFPTSDLKILDLSNNSIVNISDAIFSNLQAMEMLILSYNNIEMVHPNAFQGLYLDGDFLPLKSLKVLKLDHNRIHSLDADVFEHTDRVEVLSLAHNPLKHIDQQTLIAITSLRSLKNLDLSYTDISTLPDHFMHTPKFIQVLDLSGNKFDGIPEGLGEAHSLETLYMNDNILTNLTIKNGFPNITTLKYLHMRNMPELHSIGPDSLSNLENLEELYLYDNSKLIDLDGFALSSKKHDAAYETWPPLKKLYIQNNKLSSIDLHFFPNWNELSELDLTENPWTCECENQWMIDELMPVYLKIDEGKAKSLMCAAPIEMAHYTFFDVYEKHTEMRCLDLYGHRPERDGTLLVGILAGVLITIPLLLFIVYSYQRNWFGFFDNSPASFSRQFYRRTQSNDETF